MAEKVEAYLSNQKNTIKPDEVAENFQVLENFYVRKWWNQVATETRKLVDDKKFVSAVDLRAFYDNFIREFEHRISPLVLVQIIMPIAKYSFRKDRAGAFEFLAKFEKTVANSAEATVRLNSGQIELKLENKDKNGAVIDITEVRAMIESTQKKLDDIIGVSSVHASFYKVSSVYLKEIGNYAAYYRESLRYLGCEDIDKLSTQEKKELATLLGFAALLGQDIYNFGELLAHSILKFLEGTEEQWLLDFLVAFNSGDLAKFRQFENQWSQWPDMVKNRELLETKVRLLCLMEIAISRPAKNRNISFAEISQKAQVPLGQVEFLVMKALAKGLIRGSINQVQQMVNINWIQPRVLSSEQIANMADRIDGWRKDVEAMESFVTNNAKEIIMKTKASRFRKLFPFCPQIRDRCLGISGNSVVSPMLHLRNSLQRCNRFAVVLNSSRKFSTTRSRYAYDSEGVMNMEEKRLAFALRIRERDAMFEKHLWVPKAAVYGLVTYAALMWCMASMIEKAEEAVNANEGTSLS